MVEFLVALGFFLLVLGGAALYLAFQKPDPARELRVERFTEALAEYRTRQARTRRRG